MKAVELAKAYDPKTFEDRIYAKWQEEGSFKPKLGGQGYFTVVIPPPNVTGVLHLGHGLNNSLQDIVVRFHRMLGEATLWVPGTDHAGIATQNVVERRLKAKGLSRHDLGREKFVEETWKVKQEHHAIISRQLERIGASVDWSRERFTLDEGLSKAVREVFVTLYERDLLYKGNYLVNWCPSCGTALSDDEVDHEDTPGKMYHLRYPRIDGKGFVELATTRPETLLGDTAVAVHPEDDRYKDLVGQKVALPLTDRELPVVADTYVDKEFGTGVVKITPAHDPNDWELSKRHGLPVINILTPDGKLNDDVPPKYRGMTVKQAREAVLEDLKAGGFYIKEEDITHAVGHCYRCHTVIEPFLSEQWFVRMKPLAEKALASWRRGEVVFYPRKWENTYQHWLENIRDWCVSRQLWWGHRIPAWHCADCGKTAVSRTDLSSCPHCGSTNIEQDPDVLDTWFSSWLWPFSTLGWPEDTADLKNFYPTTALVTAYDIIFFWVARMIMAGLEFTGKAPFRDIYIHGLVRDKQGRKMSKSLGNGLDPLELVDEYGADAFKFTLAFMCAQGQDLLVDKESFKLGSKFANKIWNACRYILMNLEGRNLVTDPMLRPVDKWIYSRLNGAAAAMREAFLSYRYNDAAQKAYEFFWNDFCDWYVEATKLSLKSEDDHEKDRATTVLLDVLGESIKLLHPLLPFVTEEIYGKLNAAKGDGVSTGSNTELLTTASYPAFSEKRNDPKAEEDFAFLQELVTLVRTLRSECTISPEKKVRVLVRLGGAKGKILGENTDLVKLLGGIGNLEIAVAEGDDPGTSHGTERPRGSIAVVGVGFEAFVFIAEAADLAQLKQKFTRDIEKDRKFIASLESKLGNENFLKNAPPELVAGEKLKLREAQQRMGKLEVYIRDMA
ncbi:valine--tRNA ligase [Treponema primitia ZAS-2]|uniref:Valine--tRNA ligase n=1 Tax=Treponema primitia (strain ATCC BAA-887 / DSM 12427 / ZAS-2) TaxID=545694 RepID=F5YPD6_TREPZ|nr:valine--tRNA ligase [Treponema primitia]AEF85944.1 valine--tRNA ligase [Treponema primitia ZAS-2]